MRSSQRSKLASVIVFALISALVLGGMAWATAASFELARKNVTDEHDRKISRAVWELSNYMAGILNSETARDYTDYLLFHYREPVAVFSADGAELNADRVILQSPIAISGPPHNWIDLYFQLNQSGALSSPQIIEEALWPLDNSRFLGASQGGDRRTWEWLKKVLPGINLRERVAQVCTSGQSISTNAGIAEQRQVARAADQDKALSTAALAQLTRQYQKRRKTLQDSQVSYLPPRDCVDPETAARRVRNDPGTAGGGLDEGIVQLFGDVEISLDPITAFWLGNGPQGEPKLAFVRECHADEDVFYQGFIGDWGRLRPELLAQIAELLPDADLEPLTDEEKGSEADHARMINLPVRLKVPDIPGGASAAAWHDIRGTLITTWVAAAVVLVVAGWGLRNLVALTERRMQFAYAVTHELRTPLTTFRLYSDMLSTGLVPEGSKQEYLDTLNRESARLSSLVEDVLEYARLENHRVKLNATKTDGASLLNVISETLEKRCSADGVKARTENAIQSGQPLCTDVDLVNRIAAVLVNNACRHARGTESATVLIRLGGQDGTVHLDVIDSGPGIVRTDARTIFKPFHRGRGADSAAQGGIGLGLALACNWASLLGGRLDLAARHDPQYGGAHFRLTIPAVIQA